MITQGRVDWDSMFMPYGGFLVILLPIIRVVTIECNVPAECNEVGVSFGNGADQFLANLRIRVLRVGGICKSRIAVSYEAEVLVQLDRG